MNVLKQLGRRWYAALAVTAAAAVLAACGGSGPGSVPLRGAATSGAAAARPAAPSRRFTKSWIDPSAVPKKLLYVSDYLGGDVAIYTYPEMTFAGEIVGFALPYGVCTDRAGDVWVADYKGFAVYEFAHGGTVPVNVLTTDIDGASGCAIDPKTGNLAVTNSAGWVDVFPNAAGTPAVYALQPGQIPFYVTYDNHSDLFVDGDSQTIPFFLAELSAGASSFTPIVLDQPPANAGDLQWDGKNVVVGDISGILYVTQGATVVGTIALSHQQGMAGFYIAPSHKKILETSTGAVNVYTYPSATYLKNVSGGLEQPAGVVISP